MEQKMCTDQTGRFPTTSYRGMQYVMVLYEPTESNAIVVVPMRNRTSGEMLATYLTLVNRLKKAGIEPKLYILNNECSNEFKEAIRKNVGNFQLVPPHDHRRNVAEKAIQVFKDYFISVLCGTDTSFTVRLWCRLLRQSEHQLNMLRTSRVDNSTSTFEIMGGQKHDYNSNPFAPLGQAVEMHVMPSKRKTWEEHTKSGFYLGNSVEHYRCHEIWITDTKSLRVGQPAFFRHKYATHPLVSLTAG